MGEREMCEGERVREGQIKTGREGEGGTDEDRESKLKGFRESLSVKKKITFCV